MVINIAYKFRNRQLKLHSLKIVLESFTYDETGIKSRYLTAVLKGNMPTTTWLYGRPLLHAVGTVTS